MSGSTLSILLNLYGSLSHCNLLHNKIFGLEIDATIMWALPYYFILFIILAYRLSRF